VRLSRRVASASIARFGVTLPPFGCGGPGGGGIGGAGSERRGAAEAAASNRGVERKWVFPEQSRHVDVWYTGDVEERVRRTIWAKIVRPDEAQLVYQPVC
jgi:hypothetical protein